jgi:hypothetical protein
MRKTLRSFFLIINYKTMIITVLSLASTYLCFHYQLTANFPDMLVGVAIVFPVVFSINSAFTRRENALKQLADFKGHAIALYYATRDWPTEGGEETSKKMQGILEGMFISLQKILKEPNKEIARQLETEFYVVFSDFSTMIKELRTQGIQSGEISRMNQYISKMMIAFDNMMVVHHYRTPVTLRAYSKVFLYIFPIVAGVPGPALRGRGRPRRCPGGRAGLAGCGHDGAGWPAGGGRGAARDLGARGRYQCR